MPNPEDCENLSCECEDPMIPGHKLWACGSALCLALHNATKMPVMFNGQNIILLERDEEADHD